MLEAYRAHVAEREAEGIVPKPLSAEQVADLIELLKSPPAGEEEFHPRPYFESRTRRCR
jgi:aconitate hydratase 2/2-methylisocitrate dehydratase